MSKTYSNKDFMLRILDVGLWCPKCRHLAVTMPIAHLSAGQMLNCENCNTVSTVPNILSLILDLESRQ